MGAVQFVPSGTATVVEVYVAIIGACLPTMAPIYRLVLYGDPLSTSATGLSKQILPTKASSARRFHDESSFERLSNVEHNFMPENYSGNRRVNISSSRDVHAPNNDRSESYQMDGVMVTHKTVWSEHKQDHNAV